jgi:hypothetical protein
MKRERLVTLEQYTTNDIGYIKKEKRKKNKHITSLKRYISLKQYIKPEQ